ELGDDRDCAGVFDSRSLSSRIAISEALGSELLLTGDGATAASLLGVFVSYSVLARAEARGGGEWVGSLPRGIFDTTGVGIQSECSVARECVRIDATAANSRKRYGARSEAARLLDGVFAGADDQSATGFAILQRDGE